MTADYWNAPKSHLHCHRVRLDLKKIFTNTSRKVAKI